MSNDLITRKNDLIKDAKERFDEVADIAYMLIDLKSVKYSNINSKTVIELCNVTGKRLVRLCSLRWELLLEGDTELEEAVREITHKEPTIDEEAEVTENDLPFC